jgi:hypothetical protein
MKYYYRLKFDSDGDILYKGEHSGFEVYFKKYSAPFLLGYLYKASADLSSHEYDKEGYWLKHANELFDSLRKEIATYKKVDYFCEGGNMVLKFEKIKIPEKFEDDSQ